MQHFVSHTTLFKGSWSTQTASEVLQDAAPTAVAATSDDNWKHAVNQFTFRQHTNINQNFYVHGLFSLHLNIGLESGGDSGLEGEEAVNAH